MEIIINRLTANNLYTEGQLSINGANFCHTLEHTFTMLPIGKYKVELVKISSSHRAIAIIPQSTSVKPEHLSIIDQGDSWITAQKITLRLSLAMSPILIGIPLTPGIIKQSAERYERLFERLKKCKTPVTLNICDNQCQPNNPSSHWVKLENHHP